MRFTAAFCSLSDFTYFRSDSQKMRKSGQIADVCSSQIVVKICGFTTKDFAQGCTSLTSITIPDEVTDIENYVFRGCDNITSITIPDSVFGIGDGVFASCSSLTSITIPDNVTFIGEDAFDKCDSLTITAPKGSYAIEYAKAKGIKYIET